MKRREFVYVFFGTIVVPATLASSFIWLLMQPAVKFEKQDAVQSVVFTSPAPSPKANNKSSGGWGRRFLGLPF